MRSIDLADLDIAVALHCRNDELTVADLVDRVDEALPTARIFVMDRGSSDETVRRAEGAGAEVIPVAGPDKSDAVARMFAEIDADVLVMLDGDARDDPREMAKLIERLIVGRRDMVIGTSMATDYSERAGRRIDDRVYRLALGEGFSNTRSGYRVFSRRFSRSFPALARGLAVETELNIHAHTLRLPVERIEVSRRARPPEIGTRRHATHGSMSVSSALGLLKDVRPLLLFTSLAAGSLALGGVLAATGVGGSGQAALSPSWIMALACLLFIVAGLILDAIAAGRLEAARARSLMVPRISACELEIDSPGDRLPEPVLSTADLPTADLPTNVTRLI